MVDLRSAVEIAVIGAGAAGISAERRIAEARSASLMVLEACDRVGGRVHTIEPEKRLVMSGRAHWNGAVAKDRPSRVTD